MAQENDDGLWSAKRIGTDIHVTLAYPRTDGEATHVQVELHEVRAADNIRISYDFDRDGWKIEQASNHGPWESAEAIDEGWKEVAFIRAWALAPISPEVPRP